jgi:hypothetical protein
MPCLTFLRAIINSKDCSFCRENTCSNKDRDGNKRVAWEISAESVYFGGSKKDNDSYQTPQAQNVSAAEFEELGDSDSDGEMPV